MTQQVPPLTAEQRAEALQRSVQARRERAAIKRKIASGEMTIAQAFESAEPAVRRMKPRQLLTAVPGIGPAVADDIVQTVRIADGRRLHGLGERQKRELLDELEARGVKTGREEFGL